MKIADGEMAAPDAVHHQRVRADFQDRVRAAGVAHFREHLLQVDAIREWCWSRRENPAAFVAGGADAAGGVTGGAQNRIDNISDGGFAVGAGDADEFQRVGRAAVKIRGGYSQGFAFGAGQQFDPGNFAAGRSAGSGLGAGNGHRATRERVGDKFIAVGFRSGQREEKSIGEQLSGCRRRPR